MKNPFRWVQEEIDMGLAVLFMIWWIKPWRKPEHPDDQCWSSDYGYEID